jgi:hypothetical protein
MAPYRSPYSEQEQPKARNDVYTGLLGISFFAMLIACALLFFDWYSYDGMENPAGKVRQSLKSGVQPVAVPGKGDLGKVAPKPPDKPPDKPPVKEPPKEPEKDKMEKDKDKGAEKDKGKDEKEKAKDEK